MKKTAAGRIVVGNPVQGKALGVAPLNGGAAWCYTCNGKGTISCADKGVICTKVCVFCGGTGKAK